ncbi:MAG: M1 family metallopeptidase [Flavobacteriales bacterium]
MRNLSVLLVLLFAATATAQRFDPLHPPDTYRDADNPYYWKNRPPYEGYWQQDVHYRIKARLDETTDAADGTVTLDYWNNSPDTLKHVFFHLYQEAFNPGSYLSKLRKERPGRNGTKAPANERGTELLTMTMDGEPTASEQDNTIMKVTPSKPIPPGAHVTFAYTFRTHWKGADRRMKLFNAWGFKHYDGTHWYPRISVYDRKFGWNTQQHLGHEFYGDFGTYDVELDMPNDQVVEATGWLQNRNEVLPADLRARLDIRNFKDKPWGEKPSVITPYEPGVRKVWKYHATNVHDFAFTADPTYRIGEAQWNGIQCIALAEEPHAGKWQNAADYCAKAVEAHSTLIGMYIYPKMVVADARDGMEYPMLTLDGGKEPDYRGLFVHEVGHNWFFGMVGNNETYRAMLDEGFTQFLTAWGLEHIDGDTVVVEPARTAYERRYTRPRLAREHEVYAGYMRDAVKGTAPPINVHSDEFGYHGGGYRHVYYRTAVMLFNLQYVLGDTLFSKAMRHYFDQWKVCHPYVEDFRQSVTDLTHVDLNWFFDQWIETDKRIDYAVKGVKHRGQDSGQVIHLRRRGDMEMPIDLSVTARDGREYAFHLPNNWYVKPTTATVLPRWIGFDELQRDYFAHVDIPSGIADVRIDTTFRLGDAYQLNNSLRFPLETTFDSHIADRPDRRVYEGAVRPDLWWNGYDGAKVGVHFNGDWMRYKHQVWFTAWLNTGLGQNLRPGQSNTGFDPISLNFRYENGTERLLKGSSVFVTARLLDGLEQYGGGFKWRFNHDRDELYTSIKFMLRRDSTDLSYLLYPAQWEPDRLNSATDVGLKHHYEGRRNTGDMQVNLRNSSIGATLPYAQLSVSAINECRMGRLGLRTRLFLQYGTGTTPRESALYLAGASPEEMMENKYVRSEGFLPYDWLGYGATMGHFQQGGGLGLRGYAGYYAPAADVNGNTILTYVGNTGGAINAELDLDGLVALRPRATREWLHIDAYLFGDVGGMGYRALTEAGTQQLRIASPRADAGAGVALTVKKFGPLSGIKPLTIRFDMPLVLSNIPFGESDHFAWRYVVGIGRSF